MGSIQRNVIYKLAMKCNRYQIDNSLKLEKVDKKKCPVISDNVKEIKLFIEKSITKLYLIV